MINLESWRFDVSAFCGARYDVADVYAGKRVACPKCGSRIAVPTGRPSDLEPFDLADDDGANSATAGMTVARQEAEPVRASLRKTPEGRSAPPPVVLEASSGLWRDMFGAFNHLTSLESAISFLFVWFLNLVAASVCTFALVAARVGARRAMIIGVFGLLLYGYVSAYFMKSVTRAAAGDRGLPDHTISGSFLDDLVLPMLLWWGCLLFVLAPAIVGTFVMDSVGASAEVGLWVSVVLAGMGAFFWPICILTVSLGGFSMLLRFDALVVSIVRSPAHYLLIVALVAAALGPSFVLRFSGIVEAPATFDAFFRMHSMLLRTAIVGLECYAMLVCTRLEGLYYHHFKSDYPWALG